MSAFGEDWRCHFASFGIYYHAIFGILANLKPQSYLFLSKQLSSCAGYSLGSLRLSKLLQTLSGLYHIITRFEFELRMCLILMVGLGDVSLLL